MTYRRLCQDFPAAQMGVAAAVDATIYMPDILAASEGWTKPVLILLNLRLGLNGVNPIYHPPIKSLFSFPQSVGIAGGRPSSSYYFVGSQADSLFYIDPHHSKPAVPLPKKRPDGDLLQLALHHPLSPPRDDPAAEPDWEKVQHEQLTDAPRTQTPPSIQSPPTVEITSDESFVSEEDSWTDAGHNVETDFSQHGKRPSTSSNSSRPPLSAASSHSGSGVSSTTTSDAPKSERERALDDYFSRAYAPSELQSFHPERVRKIAISGLDPSMLVGFLVRSQEELDDWMRRSSELKPPLYSVQQNFPGWAKRGMGSRTISQTTAPPGSQSMPPRTQDSSASLTTTSDAGRSDSWDISDSEDEDDDLGAAGSTGDTSESQHAAGPIPDYSKGEKTRSRPSGEGSEEFEYDEALNQSAQTIEPTR